MLVFSPEGHVVSKISLPNIQEVYFFTQKSVNQCFFEEEVMVI